MSNDWRSAILRAFLGLGLAGFALGPGAPASLEAASTSKAGKPAPTREWEERSGCRLVTEAYSDGDSFILRWGGRKECFRLYFVDTPETDVRQLDRVVEQARHFGISTESALDLGAEAAAFTRRFLAPGATVRTRWEFARGASAQERHYAVVSVGGTNLATQLVRRGYARIMGTNLVNTADPRKAAWMAELRAADAEARQSRRGGWDASRYRRAPGAGAPGAAPRKIDLNKATFEELVSLPGVGPERARAIITGRPYRSVLDLDRVKGIGPKTLQGLTNRVSVGP